MRRRFSRRLARLALAVLIGPAACHGQRAWDDGCEADLRRIAERTAAFPIREGFLDWTSLRNPILEEPDRPLKDAAVVYREGTFFVFTQGFYRSRDLRSFERYADPDLHGPGRELGSPDVSRSGDLYHLVFQTRPTAKRGSDQARVLRISSSRDLLDWSPPRDLAPGLLDPAVRNIDGALARHGGHFWLGWKRGQSLHVARSRGPELDGRWSEARPVTGRLRFGANAMSHDWAENYQFLRIDGAWYMLATARAPGLPFHRHPYTGSHEPYLYRMEGSGERLEDWTRWRCKRHLPVPREAWNPAMHANSAYLADWREHDGHFYLFYAGSLDHEKFARRGHGKIGVARSRDLVRWSAPGLDGAH